MCTGHHRDRVQLVITLCTSLHPCFSRHFRALYSAGSTDRFIWWLSAIHSATPKPGVLLSSMLPTADESLPAATNEWNASIDGILCTRRQPRQSEKCDTGLHPWIAIPQTCKSWSQARSHSGASQRGICMFAVVVVVVFAVACSRCRCVSVRRNGGFDVVWMFVQRKARNFPKRVHYTPKQVVCQRVRQAS